jgi:type I restriction enzyme S subunit
MDLSSVVINRKEISECKKTELGWIPEDWEISELKKLTIDGISNGIFNDPDKRGSGYRLINVVNLYNEPKIDTNNLSMLDLSAKNFEKNKVELEDLLFTRSSLKLEGIAHCNINLDNSDDLIYDDHIMKMTPDKKQVNPKFIRLFCLTNIARNHFMRLAKQTTMTTISQKDVMKLPVLLPPLSEQERIIDFLSVWDSVITYITDLIQAKKRYKKGLMQQLLTGKKRFPEFEGEEWQKVRLGELFKERKEKEYAHLDLVAITTEQGVIDRDKLDRKDTSSSNKDNYKRIVPGDIGYNTMRMWQGVSGYSELKGIVSPAYTIVTPIDDKVDGGFMAYLFKFPPVIDLFRRYSQGLVSDTLNLKFSNFAQIKVDIPNTIKEQKKIAKIFMMVDKEIGLLHEKCEVIKKQKKGLMQQLLTGKVRVNKQKVTYG